MLGASGQSGALFCSAAGELLRSAVLRALPALGVPTAVAFSWDLFALLFSLRDFSIVALPENTFRRGLRPWLDGAFSVPTQPVLPVRATGLAQGC